MSARSLAVLLLSLAAMAAATDATRAQTPGAGGTQLINARGGEVFALAFSGDGRMLASAGGDHTIYLWDVATGRDLGALRGHTGIVRSVAFSRDGRWLVSGSDDATVRIWDVASRQPIKHVSSSFGAVYTVAISPDQQLVVTGSGAGNLRLIEAKSGRETRGFKRGFVTVHAAVFSPDGLAIAAGHSDGKISITDVASGAQRAVLSGHGGPVRAVAFSPQHPMLASTSTDGTVRLWDVAQGRELAALSEHVGEVYTVAFSSDGALLASGGQDGRVRLWDVPRRWEYGSLRDQRGPVWAVTFAPGRPTLAFAGRDQNIHLQDVALARIASGLAEKMRRRGAETGPATQPPPRPDVSVAFRPREARPGADLTIVMAVTNRGSGPLYGFQARTRSFEPPVDGLHFYFGKVSPGQTVEDEVTVRLPADLAEPALSLRAEFHEIHGALPAAPFEARVAVATPSRPRFAFHYQILDDARDGQAGNGDGVLQRDERAVLVLSVLNVGSVPAREVRIEVKGRAQRGANVVGITSPLGAIGPEEVRAVRLRLEVSPEFSEGEVLVDVTLRDGAGVQTGTEIALPVDPRPPLPIRAGSGAVVITASSAVIYSGASTSASVLGSARRSERLQVTGELGEWFRVAMPGGATGWVMRTDVDANSQR